MNRDNWLAEFKSNPTYRNHVLDSVAGQIALRLPWNGHTTKSTMTYHQSPLWTLLESHIVDGHRTMTAPDMLMTKVISNLDKANIPYEVERI